MKLIDGLIAFVIGVFIAIGFTGCDDGCDLCPIAVKPDAAASVSGCAPTVSTVQPDAGVEAGGITVTENIFD